VAEIDAKICGFANISAQFGEPLQGSNAMPLVRNLKPYRLFDPDGQDFKKFCSISGPTDRTMIYLNDLKPANNAVYQFGKTSRRPLALFYAGTTGNRMAPSTNGPSPRHESTKGA
jgi:prolyl 4-hydroxylase